MKVVILKYNAGNIFSVESALQRLGITAIISADKDVLKTADKIIIPGVGQARTAMEHLEKTGLASLIKDFEQPVLGICLGMQLLCSYSEEGDIDCLGIFNKKVKRFERKSTEHKIPHMGWNSIANLASPLFQNIKEGTYTYFVHSYYVDVCPHTIAACNYISPFSAALRKNNFYATQFHPEKSGGIGELILKNFITL